MSKTKVNLKDGWTTDQDYKELYQPDHEISDILDLLELKDGGTLLDNACGNGEVSIQAVLKHPELSAYGYDGLESAVKEARKRSPKSKERQLKFQVAWADKLPLEDAAVDRAVFRNALHHVTKPQLVFSEMARCLEDGGLFVMQTPFNNWEESFSSFLSDLHFVMDESHRRYYHTLDTIQRDLESSGLHCISEMPSTYYFPFVNKPMKNLILEHNFEDRLELKQIEEEKWAITLYWVKIAAEKRKAEQTGLGISDRPVS